MSPVEHYFENLLFTFAKHGLSKEYDEIKKNDSNIQYFDQNVKDAIETCTTYIIDCCNWDKNKVNELLDQ